MSFTARTLSSQTTSSGNKYVRSKTCNYYKNEAFELHVFEKGARTEALDVVEEHVSVERTHRQDPRRVLWRLDPLRLPLLLEFIQAKSPQSLKLTVPVWL